MHKSVRHTETDPCSHTITNKARFLHIPDFDVDGLLLLEYILGNFAHELASRLEELNDQRVLGARLLLLGALLKKIPQLLLLLSHNNNSNNVRTLTH